MANSPTKNRNTSILKGARREAARWFARMYNAAPDHPDRGRFEAWLMGSPTNAEEYAAISGVWEDFESTPKLRLLAKAMVHQKNESDVSETKVRKVVSTVVLSLVLVFAGLLGWKQYEALPVYKLAINSDIGEIKKKKLADGSEVTLNGNSQLEIIYYRSRRLVKLKQGEAIFYVSKDQSRPFVVDSGPARVTVLGTRFVVNRLSNLVRVSVDHGSVQVEAQDIARNALFAPLVLHNGEVAEVVNGESPQRIDQKATDAFMFERGSLSFENATLGEIAEVLSRYRKVPVRTDVHSQHSPHVTAVIRVSDVEDFLELLPQIASIRIQQSPTETRLLAIAQH